MKASFAALAIALASVASAQLDNIPSCALSCFVTVLTTDGCSGLTDFACHCKKTDLIPKVTPCVQSSCSAADQAKVITAVEGTCAEAGVPLSLSAPGGASSTPAPSSAAPSSAPVSSTPEASAPASASSAAYTTPASSAVATSLVGTSTIVSTPAANGTISTTATPSQFTGAAAQATQAAGLMAAGLLALAAAL